MIVAGAAWSFAIGSRSAESFHPRIKNPWFKNEHWRRRPLLFIDEAHGNSHTIEGGYRPFAELAGADWYVVRPNRRVFTHAGLAGVQVLTVVNGRGFSDSEVAAVVAWVRAGGGLLLMADHAAGAELAAAFGIRAADMVPGPVVFSNYNGRMSSHPVTESLENAITYSGVGFQSDGATAILKLEDGRAQGLLLEAGRGRVAIFGDAAMFTVEPDGAGIDETKNDNLQFALNTLHWLTRR